MTNISVPPLAAYRRRIRCVKRVFQTPSSNSCKRSTTSILDGLKAGPSRSTKAFYDMCIKLLGMEKKMDLTFVGTPENSLRSPSTATPAIGFAHSYINLRAASTLLAIYLRNPLTRIAVSRTRPRLSSLDFVTRHRGHGAKPLSRIVANKALSSLWGQFIILNQCRKATHFSG
jgi:hypothetical protein